MNFKSSLLCGLFTAALSVSASQAFAIETKAKTAVLMDYDTGEILFAKDHKKWLRLPL